jgi:hypothetical protein
VVLKKGSGDIKELEWVVNQKTQVPRVKLPENDKSWFRFWVGGTQGSRRDPERFWFPKTIVLGFMHMFQTWNCLKMTNPGSGFGLGDSRDPERPGEILGFQKTIVLGFMHMFLWWNGLKMTNPGSDFGLGGLRRPGETRRDLGFPKNHCFRLHAHGSRVKLPENDESWFRF